VLQGFIERLGVQMETAEADLEKLTSGKKSKKTLEEAARKQGAIARHLWHVAKMEQMVRMMDNDGNGPAKPTEPSARQFTRFFSPTWPSISLCPCCVYIVCVSSSSSTVFVLLYSKNLAISCGWALLYLSGSFSRVFWQRWTRAAWTT